MVDKNITSRVIRRRRARERHQARRSLSARLGGQVTLLTFALLMPLALLAATGFNHAYNAYASRMPETAISTQRQSISATFYASDGETVLHRVEREAASTDSWLDTRTLSPDVWQVFIAALPASTPKEAVTLAARRITDDILVSEYTNSFERWVYFNELQANLTQAQAAEWLLNTNYYGDLSYGLSAAAQYYYQKGPQALTVAEAAVLAALAEDPRNASPEQLRARQQDILARMVKFGWLSPASYSAAQLEDAAFQFEADNSASALAQLATQQLEKRMQLGDNVNAVNANLSINADLQAFAECAIGASGASECGGIISDAGASLIIVIDPMTGQVLALADNAQGDITAFSTDGRIVLPFVYQTAFEQGFAPATSILDVRTAIENNNGTLFIPENANGVYHGPINIRQALANSYEAPALQTIARAGLPSIERTMRFVGLEVPINEIETFISDFQPEPLDLVYAYTLFANSGMLVGQSNSGATTAPEPELLSVIEGGGQAVDTRTVSVVVDPTLPYLVTHILDDDSLKPFNTPAAVYSLDMAEGQRWSVGYTSDIVVAIWTTNVEANIHNTLWLSIFEQATQETGVTPVPEPLGISRLTVCETSGLLPTGTCPVVEEVFREGTEPLEFDTFYQAFEINSESGLLATVYTPPQLVKEEVFLVLPPEASEWAWEEGLPVPPQTYDVLQAPVPEGEVAIVSPEPFARLGDAVEIRGNATGNGFASYRLDYGQSFNPNEWIQIGREETTSRTNSVLGKWDTSTLDGLYSLRLTVIYDDNRFEEFITPVTIDNTPPDLQVVAPIEGERVAVEQDFVTIDAIAVDDIEMERVEFYVDGQLIAARTESPYSDRWLITSVGEHEIRVQAYDSTGNVTVSEAITIVVKP